MILFVPSWVHCLLVSLETNQRIIRTNKPTKLLTQQKDRYDELYREMVCKRSRIFDVYESVDTTKQQPLLQFQRESPPDTDKLRQELADKDQMSVSALIWFTHCSHCRGGYKLESSQFHVFLLNQSGLKSWKCSLRMVGETYWTVSESIETPIAIRLLKNAFLIPPNPLHQVTAHSCTSNLFHATLQGLNDPLMSPMGRNSISSKHGSPELSGGPGRLQAHLRTKSHWACIHALAS